MKLAKRPVTVQCERAHDGRRSTLRVISIGGKRGTSWRVEYPDIEGRATHTPKIGDLFRPRVGHYIEAKTTPIGTATNSKSARDLLARESAKARNMAQCILELDEYRLACKTAHGGLSSELRFMECTKRMAVATYTSPEMPGECICPYCKICRIKDRLVVK